MARYEYKVIPAPTRGVRAKGVKTPEGRFANALETALNALGAEGWEYCRADTLPSSERQGLTGSTTTFRNVLVFRRAIEDEPVAQETEDAILTILPPPQDDPSPEPPAEEPVHAEMVDAEDDVPDDLTIIATREPAGSSDR